MILCAGLSPAWQQVFEFERLEAGEVNRALRAHQTASGKVLNAVRAVQRLGGAAAALTLLGGPLGETVRGILAGEGIALHAVRSRAPTRTCTTVIERASGQATELVENAGPVTADELAQLVAMCQREGRAASHILLMGSLAAGAPATTFRDLVAGLDAEVLADVRGPELLALLPLEPLLVKPNRAELARTLERSLERDAELHRAMAELADRGARWVVVTSGRQSVWLRGGGGLFRIEPPRIRAVNPIGSGDVLAGALAAALARGEDAPEATAYAVAAAVENTLTLLPGEVDRDAVERRRAEVRVERIA